MSFLCHFLCHFGFKFELKCKTSSWKLKKKLKTKIAEHLFFYHEGLKAEKDPNHRIIEPQADDMRRKISNYGDYYLPPRGDSLDLRTRVRDHIYAIDNEFSMENDPSYRWGDRMGGDWN